MLSIKKKDQKVWVTFTYEASDDVSQVSLCGEWNDWKEDVMKRKKSGDFYITKVFKINNTFEFGYKVNDKIWCCEDECENISSPYLTKNSLLKL